MSNEFKPMYMMATTAIHQLGDISSDEPDLCYVTSEDEDNYIGHWVEGFDFINVKFPKDTTRRLTEEETQKYSTMQLAQILGMSHIYLILLNNRCDQ